MTSCTWSPRGVGGEDTWSHSNIVSDLFECLLCFLTWNWSSSVILPFKAKNGLFVYFLTHKKCLAIMRLFFIGLRLLKRPSLLHFWHRFKYFRMWFSSQQLLCIFSGCERMWDWEPAPVLFGNAGSQMLNKAQNCENMASHHFSI